MVAVLRGFAADRFDGACVDVEFESADGFLHSFLGEDVEELFDDGPEHSSVFFWAVSPLDVFVDLVGVFLWIVCYEVVAGWEFVFVDGHNFTVFFEKPVEFAAGIEDVFWFFVDCFYFGSPGSFGDLYRC